MVSRQLLKMTTVVRTPQMELTGQNLRFIWLETWGQRIDTSIFDGSNFVVRNMSGFPCRLVGHRFCRGSDITVIKAVRFIHTVSFFQPLYFTVLSNESKFPIIQRLGANRFTVFFQPVDIAESYDVVALAQFLDALANGTQVGTG